MLDNPAPSVYIDSKYYPEIKDYKPGKKYSFSFRMTSRTEDKDGGVRGDFELVKEGVDKPGSDTKED